MKGRMNMQGIVKSFDNNKGYGFIKSDEIEKDIFVHYSDVKMDGFRKLFSGDFVEFDYDPEKIKAKNVIVCKKNDTRK